jgi:hypothetical protein
MSRSADNEQMLDAVAEALGDLVEAVVFIGGATVGLHLTNPAAADDRPTEDVDVIADVAALADYYELCEHVRQRGFAEDPREGAPICRWRHGALTLDLMPTDESVLGFTNRWYEATIATSTRYTLPSGAEIRIATPPLLLATKLEAFLRRGKGDVLASRDLEDSMQLLDGREELLGEIGGAAVEIRQFIGETMKSLIDESDLIGRIATFLPPDEGSQARAEILAKRCVELTAFAAAPT